MGKLQEGGARGRYSEVGRAKGQGHEHAACMQQCTVCRIPPAVEQLPLPQPPQKQPQAQPHRQPTQCGYSHTLT